MSATTLEARIAALVELHGSLRAAAKSLDCDVGYLSRLARGEKLEPSSALLERMDLKRVVTYERLTPNRWAGATPLTPRTKSA